MAKPRPAPDPNSRESTALWSKMFDASDKRRMLGNTQFLRFARWLGGDLFDVVDSSAIAGQAPRWRTSSLGNMLYLVTAASMADLLFRWPRFVVRPPYVMPPPNPMTMQPDATGQMPPQPIDAGSLFTPELARCETTYLAYVLRQVGYRETARRALQDALIGPRGVLMVSSDQEVAVDENLLNAAAAQADQEINDFVAKGVKMKAQEDQIHSVHIQRKSAYVAQAERNQTLPGSALKYMKKHIAVHAAMKTSERPAETIRAASIRIDRINPVDYFYDPTADDRRNCMWRGRRFLMRKADVLANEKYDEVARKEIPTIQDRWMARSFLPVGRLPGGYDLPEEMVMIREVFDFVEQKRRVFAEGGTHMLIPGEDRGDLKVLEPSGPFVELVFVQDPMEGDGIAPPTAIEAEQAAYTHILTSNVAAAIQSAAKILYNANDISAAEMDMAYKAPVASACPVTPRGDPKKAIRDMFEQVPRPEIAPQVEQVLNDLATGIAQRSGLGVSKTLGGEQSPTATGAALGADASGAIGEDRGATCDEWQEATARRVVRRIRRYVPKAQVIDVCGPEATQFWPDRFSISDAANDIGVEIVPGSSRRRNTAVDQKQLLDGITAMQNDPIMQGPAAGKLRLNMYRMFFEDNGATGLDFNSVQQEIDAQAQMAQMQQAQGGEPEGDEGAPPGKGKKKGAVAQDSGKPTSENDLHQGTANVGGGRVGTGASIADRIAANRNGAVASVASRGAGARP